jgi:DNA ligase-1
MKTFETLYARNSNGKINQWKISAEDDGTIIISEGIIGGAMTSSMRQSKGKNIGKMNETTPYQQAYKDAQSRWENKKKKGYKDLESLGITPPVPADLATFESMIDAILPKNRTDANDLSKPMKAQPYFDDKGNVRIKFPCIGQPKLNGFRVIARLETVKEGDGMFAQDVIKPTFRSKEGLRYTVLEHIEEEVERAITSIANMLQKPLEDIALDGEIYCHGMKLQDISSAVKKRNPNTNKLYFCVFDLAIDGFRQNQRLKAISVQPHSDYKYIRFLEGREIRDDAHAQKETNDWIKEGYEGGIFRDPKAVYQFGSRPKTMVKLKRTEDEDFRIVDIIGGENTPDVAVFVCVTKDNKPFKVNSQGTLEQRKEFLSNKRNYLGKLLQLKFYEYTNEKIPFHIKEVVVRDYE